MKIWRNKVAIQTVVRVTHVVRVAQANGVVMSVTQTAIHAVHVVHVNRVNGMYTMNVIQTAIHVAHVIHVLQMNEEGRNK